MAAVQQGTQAAFATLVARHHSRCFTLAWRVLNDPAEAEDAVQDAFLKLWNNKISYDPARGNFSGWLTRIVTNSALDRRRLVKDVSALENAGWVADDAPRADRLAESADLHRTMAAMPARQRAAITLFYIEGLSMAEVAEVMGSNPKAVESMLSRGRTALKALLTETEDRNEVMR
ncbi:MAG: sigma-70 family RNA polymerase sigma factor [Alphaproteobacteria bacterium]|nr:sigma-70 family RNA polymerase sigma factor [Alphaproteobacteria bacterium]